MRAPAATVRTFAISAGKALLLGRLGRVPFALPDLRLALDGFEDPFADVKGLAPMRRRDRDADGRGQRRRLAEEVRDPDPRHFDDGGALFLSAGVLVLVRRTLARRGVPAAWSLILETGEDGGRRRRQSPRLDEDLLQRPQREWYVRLVRQAGDSPTCSFTRVRRAVSLIAARERLVAP